MSDRPISFGPERIRDIIREVRAPGTGKTQTRRILNPQPELRWCSSEEAEDLELKGFTLEEQPDGRFRVYRVPYAVGSILWVKESFAGRRQGVPDYIYRADNGLVAPERWQSSRFMPRAASRLTLMVNDVRVQRLHDIRELDARAEGAERVMTAPPAREYQHGFMRIWNDVHKDPKAWGLNPWVCAITFTPRLANIRDVMRTAA